LTNFIIKNMSLMTKYSCDSLMRLRIRELLRHMAYDQVS
jgi:hypothetical protein